MKLPELIIGKLKSSIPIIQGGMGIGVSLSGLASAVANEGGIGVISSAQIGFSEPDFIKNNLQANLRALKREIKLAREKSPRGILGVNLMVAANNYGEYVKTSIHEKIDIIFSGAGLPLDLPKLVKGSMVKISPIVSSSKAASIICKFWDKKYNVVPDLVVVEGPEAGGHLGFHKNDISNTSFRLSDIVTDVKNTLKPYQEKYKRHIPVIAAGGIFDGNDIAELLNSGADGVQMATRFVATDECDADQAFKQAYVSAQKDDVIIVASPVGMPGRAIKNKFIENLDSTRKKINCLYNCLRPCDPLTTPYCISEALINARNGDLDNGLIFCGSNVYRINNITSVKELMKCLVEQAELKFHGISPGL